MKFAPRVASVLSILALSLSSLSALADTPGRVAGDPNLALPRGQLGVHIPGPQRGVHYESVTGGKPVTPQVLFGKNGQTSGRDARQGSSGDCYVLAAAAVYAQFHPNVVKSIFLDDKGQLRVSASGAPAARFFQKDRATGEFKTARPATYHDRAPVDSAGKTVLNRIANNKFWPNALEYTYTKFRNQQGGAVKSDDPNVDRTGFNRTFNGGYANHVMQALTGEGATTITVTPRNADEVWAKLKEAQAGNKVVVVGSTTPGELRSRVRDEAARGNADGRTSTRFDERRWVDGHAYSAWGDKQHPFVFEKDGVRYIRLRNPWGTNAPGGEGKGGVGDVPFDKFVLRFDRVYVGAGEVKAD